MAGGLTNADAEVAQRFDAYFEQHPLVPAPTHPDKVDRPNSSGLSAEQQAAAEAEVEREIVATRQEDAAPAEGDAEARAQAEAAAAAEAEGAEATGEEVGADAEADGDLTLTPEATDDEIVTLANLAGVFNDEEVTEDTLLDLEVAGRNEGEQISLRDALQLYRNGPTEDEHFQSRLNEVQLDLTRAHDVELAKLSRTTAGMITSTQARFANTNWDQLESEQPEEYIRLFKEQQAMNGQIEGALEQLDQSARERDESQSVKLKAWKRQQIELIDKLHPEWRDPQQGPQAMKEIQTYLVRSGFSREQMRELSDARSIDTAWKAAQWDKLQAAKPALKRRMRGLTPSLKATTRTAEAIPEEVRRKASQDRAQAHREQGTVDTAAAMFREVI